MVTDHKCTHTYPICGVRPSPLSKRLLRSFVLLKVVRAAPVVVLRRSKEEKQSTTLRCIFFQTDEWIQIESQQMANETLIYIQTLAYVLFSFVVEDEVRGHHQHISQSHDFLPFYSGPKISKKKIPTFWMVVFGKLVKD